MVLLYLFETYRLALRALVVLMSLHYVVATVGYLRTRRRVHPTAPLSPLPHVTVQLPVRDEYYTVLRAMKAAAALDYPRELLEIQVLDDSDDSTVEVIREAATELRAAGVDIVQLRRFTPTDYKAGALAYGLSRAKGELLAIFDADFEPPRDFLTRVLPHFSDPSVALVQGRWEHANREESWFTRLQAQVLDGLMVVEQGAKSAAGLPFQFNGTAGVWRKAAILAAGGWTFDSLTEDFDLSLRANLAGWKFVHLPGLGVPSEVPRTLGLFRVQQRRWALGTAQLLRKRFGAVLRAPLGIGGRLALLFQLGRHFGYPLLVVMVMTVPLTTFGHVHTLIEYGPVNAVVLALAVAAVALEQIVAEAAIGRSVLQAAVLAPFSIALAIGLSPTYTVALYYGLRDRAGPFHRTPKVTHPPAAGEPMYRAARSSLVFVELAIGIAYGAFTALALVRNIRLEAGFLALVSLSFLWVGIGSLHVDPTPRQSRDEPRRNPGPA